MKKKPMVIDKEELKKDYYSRIPQPQIAIKYKTSLSVIERALKEYGISGTRSKHLFVINEQKIDLASAEFWYFIGLFATDGHINVTKHGSLVVNFTMAGEDGKEILQKVKEFFEYTGEIKAYRKRDRDTFYYYLGISNALLAKTLRGVLKYHADKTSTLQFPDLLNVEHKQSFLRGVFDGDGSFGIGKGRYYNIQLFTNSQLFKNGLVEAIREVTKFVNISPCKNGWLISINKRQGCYRLLKFLYSPCSTFYISRKKAVATKIMELFLTYLKENELMI